MLGVGAGEGSHRHRLCYDAGMDVNALFIDEIRRRMFDESQVRVNRCLDMLDEAQVWHRPNDACNAVGNLVLHLCGNINQWVVATLGGRPDDRQRNTEFEAQGPMPVAALKQRFNAVLDEANAIIAGLDPASLPHTRRAQGFDETVLAILIHVTEHLSYHTGQITFITKMLTAQQTGYYDGHDLNATNSD